MVIGIAIIGAGIFAREAHAPAVLATPSLELRAVYSRSLSSARTVSATLADADLYSDDQAHGTKKTLDDLLSRNDVQAVIIALPIICQPEFIRKALAAAKHVLSEKPIAPDVAEAKKLIDWYESGPAMQGHVWHVAENYRFLKAFVQGAKLKSGMGSLRGFELRKHWQQETRYLETEWRRDPEHQGGFLLDAGVHFIAGLRLLLGKENAVVSLCARTTLKNQSFAPLDTVEAVVRTMSGACGTVSISFATTSRESSWSLDFFGGDLTVCKTGITIKGEQIPVVDDDNGVKEELGAWSAAILTGGLNDSRSAREALADLELVEAMIHSSEQNGKIVELLCQTW